MSQPLLSLNFSSTEIQSLLFEKEAGRYALLGSARQAIRIDDAQSLMPAFQEVMRTLEAESGMTLLDEKGKLAHEGHADLDGLSAVGFSLSGAKPIRVALMGISEAYSMASLRRLVSLFDTEIVLEVQLQAPHNQSKQLQALSDAEIDMLVIAGGAEEGASRALRNAIENTRLLYHLMPKAIQPQIVYAGNPVLADYARLEIEAGDDFHLAPNLRSGDGQEDLSVAWRAMLRAYQRVRLQQYPHLRELQAQLKAPLMPASFAMGRLARFIAALSETNKSVLLADLSDDSSLILLANKKELMATRVANTIDDEIIQKTQYYCSQPVSLPEVGEYLMNKQLHPEYFAVGITDFAIDQAWSRACLWRAMRALKAINPRLDWHDAEGLNAPCDPIILSGARFIKNLQAHQTLAIALDGILPHGISTIALDDMNLLCALGTLAEKEPLLVVQMLELDYLHNLGSVVSISSKDYEEHTLLELEVVTADDAPRSYSRIGWRQLEKIETASEDGLRVYLAPSAKTDVGMGMVGLGGWVTVPKSALGLVLDARGRPLTLPESGKARAESWRDWLWELGA